MNQQQHSEEWIAVNEEIARDEGFHDSARPCPVCERGLMVHVTHKPFRWESDVTVVTFWFYCPSCDYRWAEYDSD